MCLEKQFMRELEGVEIAVLDVACGVGPAAGAGTSCNRDCFMCHHNWDPVWAAAV